MPANFSIADIAGTLLALLVLPLFFVVPGYVLGWALNLVRFREQTAAVRFVLSIPLSVSLTPAVLYLLGRQFTVAAVWVFFASAAVAFVFLATRRGFWPRRINAQVKWIALAWTATALLSLIDLQLGNRLYYSITAYDYSVRSAVIGALARTASYPPANPFFLGGGTTPFRYHYFYFLLCGLPNRLWPVAITPRHALFAGVIAIGFGLICTLYLYLRFFAENGAHQIHRRMAIGLGLLCISGLDILFSGPKLLGRMLLHRGSVYPSIDWWNADQVAGWFDTALWVPHHLAGLIACLMGFLILWDERASRPRGQAILGAALAFAAATGLSIYVSFVFGIFLAAWSGALLLRRNYREFTALVVSGLLAGLLASPFLLDLLSAGAAGTASGADSSFLRFSVRLFSPSAQLLQFAGLDEPVPLLLTNLLFLPLNYFVELGLFFIAGVIQARQWIRREAVVTHANAATILMVVASLAVCSLFRSNTISNNDLGMRGILIAQFCLLLWAVDVLVVMNLRKPGQLIAITFLLGAATNVYELISLRTFTVLADSGFDPGPNYFIQPNTNFGRQVFDYRAAYEWLDRNTPAHAVEQTFPIDGGDFSPRTVRRPAVRLAYLQHCNILRR